MDDLIEELLNTVDEETKKEAHTLIDMLNTIEGIDDERKFDLIRNYVVAGNTTRIMILMVVHDYQKSLGINPKR